jgi:hypothetical protein
MEGLQVSVSVEEQGPSMTSKLDEEAGDDPARPACMATCVEMQMWAHGSCK